MATINGNDGEGRFLVIGKSDRLADIDLVGAVREGLGLNIVGVPFDASPDLAFLERVAPYLTRLAIRGVGVSNVDVVEMCVSLRRLTISPDYKLPPFDISRLSQLTSFTGSDSFAPAVYELKTLEQLMVQTSNVQLIEACRSPLRSLSIVTLPGVYSVPRMSQERELRRLHWNGGSVVDLQHVGHYSGLEFVSCARVTSLKSFGAVAELPRLERVWLTAIRSAEPMSAFAAIDQREIQVEIQGKNGFALELQSRYSARASWMFS